MFNLVIEILLIAADYLLKVLLGFIVYLNHLLLKPLIPEIDCLRNLPNHLLEIPFDIPFQRLRLHNLHILLQPAQHPHTHALNPLHPVHYRIKRHFYRHEQLPGFVRKMFLQM